ncbi:hypothetical protein KKD19_06395 [Patescibacteria group bacterium]|nr:hypothetical protein [Patescibacteria group bacterium]MBU4512832.1 hypothetical protein [Patescibacteria group bacterium]MCG2688575.1 hypothetical protein [Candidatus Parcubacteria bacterium]
MLKRKTMKIKEITCAFCKGAGKDPFGVPSKLSTCQVCFGRGKITLVDQPHETCTACRGTGIFAHHRLPCSVCKGKGVVPKDGREGKKGLDPDTGLPCIGNY